MANGTLPTSSALRVALLLVIVHGTLGASRLDVHPSDKGNTSCPWRLNLIENDGNSVVRCIDELAVIFSGSSSGTLNATVFPDRDYTETLPDDTNVPSPDYKPIHEGNLYKLHSRPVRWHVAKDTCEKEGAHLVVLNSLEEVKAVLSLIGQRNYENSISVHVGFYRELVTLSGHPLPFTWHERWSEPDLKACGQMDSDGFLLLGSCEVKQPFVCEYEPPSTPTTASPPTSSPAFLSANFRGVAVPEGYEEAPGWNRSYYKWGHFGPFEHASSRIANERCESENAHLAAFESEEEREAIIDMIQKNGKKDERELNIKMYVGVRKGELITVQGDLVSKSGYSRWSYSPLHTREDLSTCFWVNYKLILHSKYCDQLGSGVKSFLCEIDSNFDYD